MTKTCTTLELIADRAFVATNAANARRAAKTYAERTAHPTDMQAYREGESAAYNDAHKLVSAELKRLCNLFQNGALQISDFGIHL